jgi:mannose-6-phosphate isomerase-like protein (cupin superfamily)
MDESLLQIRGYEGVGFQPQVAFNSWQVAVLNYLDEIHPQSNNKLERHTETDEVFVLVKGCGILIIGGNGQQVESILPQEMEIGKIYNVRVNTWHTILLSRDASVLLIEERSTTRTNTEFAIIPEKLHNQIMQIAGNRF